MAARLAVVIFVLAVAAGGARAKGPVGLELCGSGDCVAVAQDVSEAVFISQEVAVPVGMQPYFELRWGGDGAPPQVAYWIPGANVVRLLDGDGAWTRLDATTATALARLSTDLRPYTPPKLTSVFVGDRVARDPASYARLFGGGRLVQTWTASAWMWIEFAGERASPWTRDYELRISRTGPYVWRDWSVFRISPALVRRARRGLSLAP